MSDEAGPHMTLTSPDGLSVRLSITGYQFPAHMGDSLNWLMIEGEVSHPRGNWSFRDPALETDKVEELCSWLARVGAAPTSPQAPLLFTEPNIEVHHRIEHGEASIVLRLAYESAPPWCKDQQARFSGVALAFPVASNGLTECAEALRVQLARFPSRE